jgi:hypothetical protein
MPNIHWKEFLHEFGNMKSIVLRFCLWSEKEKAKEKTTTTTKTK